MLRIHRKTHRQVWLILGPILALSVIVGLANRPRPLIQPPIAHETASPEHARPPGGDRP
jgi:hypothetical protein